MNTYDSLFSPMARFSRMTCAVAVVMIAGLIFTGCAVPQTEAQGTSSWEIVETEGEPSPRHENAFVELDGKFYLIGGRGEHPVDIYDPEENTWTSGAAPPLEIHHMQAVAYDGDIYIMGAWTGGFPDERGIENVLMYDPQEDAWSTGAEIPEDRRRGAAGVVVYGEHIYVVAGNDGGHGPHATAVDWFDRFDPQTGTWESLPPAPRGRDHFHAAVVGDRLYAVGGRNSGVEGFIDSTFAAVDMYDFESGSWSTLTGAPLPTERAGSPTTAAGRHVIITGGEGFGQTWGETEALDTEFLDAGAVDAGAVNDEASDAAGPWTLIGTLNQPRHGTQAIVYDGRIWVAAGAGDQGGGPELTTMEVFNLSGLE